MTTGQPDDGTATPQLELLEATGKRCQAITKDGIACTAWAMPGGLCFLHANPAKASELGQRGGKAKSSTPASAPAEYVRRTLKNVDDVTSLLADTINDLREGNIDPKLANTVGYLATGMLKALQQGDIESRLRALEAVEGSRSKRSRSKADHADPPAPVPTIYSRLNASKGN